ncbi:MAG: ATP-binding protein [Pseudomonadota bacterium]
MATRLELQPDLAEVARLNVWLDSLCSKAGLDDAISGDMKLCLNEAVANVIAYGDITSGRITCDLVVDATRAKAVLSDPGVPFNPLAAAVQSPMDGLDTAQIGGFGIKLIRETASEIDYLRQDGRNILTLICA